MDEEEFASCEEGDSSEVQRLSSKAEERKAPLLSKKARKRNNRKAAQGIVKQESSTFEAEESSIDSVNPSKEKDVRIDEYGGEATSIKLENAIPPVSQDCTLNSRNTNLVENDDVSSIPAAMSTKSTEERPRKDRSPENSELSPIPSSPKANSQSNGWGWGSWAKSALSSASTIVSKTINYTADAVAGGSRAFDSDQ